MSILSQTDGHVPIVGRFPKFFFGDDMLSPIPRDYLTLHPSPGLLEETDELFPGCYRKGIRGLGDCDYTESKCESWYEAIYSSALR